MIKEWLPAYEYAKIKKTSKQNVYRWIRERKIPEDKIRIVEKTVKRIEIKNES